MAPGFSRYAGWQLSLIVLCCISALAIGRGALQASQQPGEVQTGPITEPRGAEQPSGPPVAKGVQAITQREAKCSERLSVNADALFAAGRWTLNPDAGQTLEALAPMITKAGKHPVRIEAFTNSAAGSDTYSQTLSEKRAITVRGLLMNLGYVPENTLIEGFGKGSTAAPKSASRDSERDRVEVVIDTCK